MEATLAGRDYPAGSNGFYTHWKLAMGVAHMCELPRIARAMRELDMIKLLENALVRAGRGESGGGFNREDIKGNEKLVRYSLEGIWNMTHLA